MTHEHLAAPSRRLARALGLAAALAAASDATAQVRPTGDTTRTAAADTTRRATDSTAANPARPPQGGTAAAGPRVDSLLTQSAAMGGRIRLRTVGVDEWAKAGHDASKLVLYLDGRRMDGAVANRVSGARPPELWEVRLRRDPAARDAWEAVLGSPDSLMRYVRVGLGPAAGPEFASAADSAVTLGLVVARRGWLWLTATLWLLLIVGFVYLARTTGIIRDSPAPIPPPPGDAPTVPPAPPPSANPLVAEKRAAHVLRQRNLALRPYSMARSQMAFWFIVIATAFLAIWMITGDWHGVITTQALFLMGLGAGTALAAGTVEANTREVQATVADRMGALEVRRRELVVDKASRGPAAPAAVLDDEMRAVEETRAALRSDTPEAPASKGFFRDILSEKDGPALHRYQHFVWTLIVGAVFVIGAWQTLALPDLDATMLLLMGISAATYVGFKARENQS
ncbi:MAG TPA: hypothetical protein VGO40_21175 [Longimicrobium sp.]|jgi:hypothetical protein|nr:hypothetical protein [Longimicrobium sp.]